MLKITSTTFFLLNSLSILMLGIISAFFFYYLKRNSEQSQRQTSYYFMLYYILTAFALIATYLRVFGLESISIFANNILYIVGTYAMWHGIAHRNGSKLSLLKNKFMYANVVFIIILNFFIFYLWHDEIKIRIAILATNLSLIFLSVFFTSYRHLQNSKKPADKLLKFMIIFMPIMHACFLLILGLGHLQYYLILITPAQIAHHFMWSMALTTILMLDVVEQHYIESITDKLSGLYNRRFFEKESHKILAEKSDNNLAFIICDLDDFKNINDTYGHNIGDLIIQETSKCIKQIFKKDCIYGRYGGEEFVMLCSIHDKNKVLALAKKFNEEVANIAVSHNGLTVNATISVGVSFTDNQSTTNNTVSNDNIEMTVHDYLKQADDALYHAKKSGKNRVCVA